MTIRLIVKGLLYLWPYIRSAIFKDRTVKEVLIENVYITIMLMLIISLVFTLALTNTRIAELKVKRIVIKEYIESPCDCNSIDKKRLNDLLRENAE